MRKPSTRAPGHRSRCPRPRPPAGWLGTSSYGEGLERAEMTASIVVGYSPESAVGGRSTWHRRQRFTMRRWWSPRGQRGRPELDRMAGAEAGGEAAGEGSTLDRLRADLAQGDVDATIHVVEHSSGARLGAGGRGAATRAPRARPTHRGAWDGCCPEADGRAADPRIRRAPSWSCRTARGARAGRRGRPSARPSCPRTIAEPALRAAALLARPPERPCARSPC